MQQPATAEPETRAAPETPVTPAGESAPAAEPLPAESSSTDPGTGATQTSSAQPAAERPAEPVAAGAAETVAPESGGYWGLCGTTYPDLPAGPEDPRPLDERPIVINADRTRAEADGSTVVEGSVVLTQGDRRIEADRITLDGATRKVEAEGALRYSEPGVLLEAQRARIALRERTGTLEEVQYTVPQRHGRGEGKRAEFIGRPDKHDELRLTGATYTTCDPGKEDWVLRAREMELYRATGRAVAHDILLDFMDVPVFYWPYLDFPIDNQRHSGFLVPTLGTSGDTGLDFSLPYYLNLAPNYDATLTPRIMSDRGFQAQGEFRYLTPGNEGQATLEVLPHDKQYGDDRELFSLRNLTTFSPSWSANVEYTTVTDRDYLEDLGTNVDLTNTTHLVQRAEMRYERPDWSLIGRVQGYQTLDRNIARVDFPHERLPQIIFDSIVPWQPAGLRLGLRSEYAYFEHSTAVTGERVDVEPSISLPLEGASWFVTPEMKYRYTGYRLDQVSAGADESPRRTTPVYSLDAGLFFERPYEWRGQSYTQTLEPRLYYLYVPYSSQDEIPLFDSAQLDFSFDQLFRDNRYSGRDRLGDANQLAAALTTRLLNNRDGRERLKASVGSVFYFRDQQVFLETGEFATQEGSADLVGELAYWLYDDWYGRTNLQWNTETSDLRQGILQLHYQPDRSHILNFAYRVRNDLGEPLEQTDVSLLWPVNRRWSVVSRWDYSLEDQRTMDAFVGFEYGSCCWAVRMLVRHYVDDIDKTNNAIYLQVVLRGLTQVGQSIGSLLENGILGYSVQTDENP